MSALQIQAWPQVNWLYSLMLKDFTVVSTLSKHHSTCTQSSSRCMSFNGVCVSDIRVLK